MFTQMKNNMNEPSADSLDDRIVEYNGEPFLFIEPYNGGSHKQLIDIIINGLNCGKEKRRTYLVFLPAKKWHWRARTSALYFSQVIPHTHKFKVLFASCVLNLAELIALRPDLAQLKKIIYFHENQLVYPVRKEKDRDFQYGYNEILTCLVSDIVLFNSKFNQDSFVNSINKFMHLQPDHRPRNLKQLISPKCSVLYFPIKFPKVTLEHKHKEILHIVWPHRWEHDKNPEMFFRVLFSMLEEGHQFQVSVLGETFSDNPPVFEEAQRRLGERILHWGYLLDKKEYYSVLKEAHVVVSTALHEFFGVAMLEAVFCGCFPLCPNSLVYPEIYPSQCLYLDEQHLTKTLTRFCTDTDVVQKMRLNLDIDFDKYNSEIIINKYNELFAMAL